jgi:hypothetical protein
MNDWKSVIKAPVLDSLQFRTLHESMSFRYMYIVSTGGVALQVFIRPLKATLSLSASMKPKLEAAKAKARSKL